LGLLWTTRVHYLKTKASLKHLVLSEEYHTLLELMQSELLIFWVEKTAKIYHRKQILTK